MGEGHQRGLDEDIEQAWRDFRVALADGLAGLVEDGVWLTELPDADLDADAEGAVPYVQVVRWGGGLLRAETVSNAYLDPARALDEHDERLLRHLGWTPPTHEPGAAPDEGSANYWLDVGPGEVDRVALMVVRTVREVHGCLHPAFLVHDALPALEEPRAVGPRPSPGREAPRTDPPAEPRAEAAAEARAEAGNGAREPVYPADRDALVAAVGAALADLLEVAPTPDEDGDWPIVVGRSVLLVRVPTDEPVVELEAEVVQAVPGSPRVHAELDALNREHRFASFHTRDDVVVLRHALCAWPFVPGQLAILLDQLTSTLEDVRRGLMERVGGRGRLDPPPPRLTPRDIEARLALSALIEMRHAGPVSPRSVVAAFSRDRGRVLAMIRALRLGQHDLEGLDRDEVVHLLRLALRLISDGRAELAARPPPVRPVSEQASLLDDADVGQDALDLDQRG